MPMLVFLADWFQNIAKPIWQHLDKGENMVTATEPFKFLVGRAVGAADLERIFELTITERLAWGSSSRGMTLEAWPPGASRQVPWSGDWYSSIGQNIRGVRLGHTSDLAGWRYFQVVSGLGVPFCVEAPQQDDCGRLVDDILYAVVRILKDSDRLSEIR